MRKGRFLLALWLLIAAGGALWYIQFSPQLPSFSWASQFPPQVTFPDWRDTAAAADKVVAQGIRDIAEGKMSAEEIFPLKQVGQATLSAQISATPEELWRTLREEGSQAVLQSLGEKVEYSVNGVSTAAVNEARYQYCKGVVDTYENR